METLHLAPWETRFWAWLIDFILVLIVAGALKWALLPVYFVPHFWEFGDWWFISPGLQSVVFFAYWTLFEGSQGQSIGKMAMNLRVTDRSGAPAGFGRAAIESFGKAFILPIDCLIGWLAMPDTKLRLFNRLSDTVVIVTEYNEPEGVQYIKAAE